MVGRGIAGDRELRHDRDGLNILRDYCSEITIVAGVDAPYLTMVAISGTSPVPVPGVDMISMGGGTSNLQAGEIFKIRAGKLQPAPYFPGSSVLCWRASVIGRRVERNFLAG
jgi:hypothetical protein